MKFILETEKLILREFTPDDAVSIYHLNLDPDVIRYTGDKPFDSPEHARRFLAEYDHYNKYGIGRWAVIKKQESKFIGWCGLKYSIDKNEYDIGFRFFKEYWNKGYATESAKACIALAFNKYNLNAIVGQAMRENTRSIKVLEKAGLVYHKSFDFDGYAGVIYKTEKPILHESNP